MSRPNNVFKSATNRFMDLLAAADPGGDLASEAELTRALDASRTTVRRVLRHAVATGVLCESEGVRHKARPPTHADYFDDSQISSRPQIIERTLMAMILDGRLCPGERLSEADLARCAGVSTAAVREFLIDFSRFGLVRKRPHGGWTLNGFDVAYADELAEIRQLFELSAMDRLAERGLSPDDRTDLDRLIAGHQRLQKTLASDYMQFPSLDQEFHAWIISHLRNRFAEHYLSVISIVFIYHYQWRRNEERHLNAVALAEHLAILNELRAERFVPARAALVRHLTTSRAAMLRSLAPDLPGHRRPSERTRPPGPAQPGTRPRSAGKPAAR